MNDHKETSSGKEPLSPMDRGAVEDKERVPIGSLHGRHLAYQRDYFAKADRRRILPADTPYVRRHFEKVKAVADLHPGQHVLEVGAGMGRYTGLLVKDGLHTTAMDLSPELIQRLRSSNGPRPQATLVCDIAEISRCTNERYDRAVGFFVLHHLLDLEECFGGIRSVLRPGGRVAFCEPNGYNPLFYVQIAVSPSMTWRGDGGFRRMRPRSVLRALAEAGFDDLAVTLYGFFPPFVFNTRAGQFIEKLLGKVPLPDASKAFQIFSGRVAD